jgi:hypothetical protein
MFSNLCKLLKKGWNETYIIPNSANITRIKREIIWKILHLVELDKLFEKKNDHNLHKLK